MILEEKHILKLKNLGLDIRSDNTKLYFSLSEKSAQENTHLSYLKNPSLKVEKIGSIFNLVHWEWTPGPGPGDFSLDFLAEDEVVEFIESYYFGTNSYREILKTYVKNNRKSYNSQDLEFILQKLIVSIKNKFEEKEIALNERGTYHKISIENWNITETKPENPTITVGWGYLNHELGDLRDKLSKAEDFSSEDIEKVASLLMDLSINLQKETAANSGLAQ